MCLKGGMTNYWRFFVELAQFLLSNAMLLGHRHDLALNVGEIGHGRHLAIVKIGILPKLLLGLFLLLLLLISWYWCIRCASAI